VVLEASGRLPRLIARRSAVRTAVARGGLEVLIAGGRRVVLVALIDRGGLVGLVARRRLLVKLIGLVAGRGLARLMAAGGGRCVRAGVERGSACSGSIELPTSPAAGHHHPVGLFFPPVPAVSLPLAKVKLFTLELLVGLAHLQLGFKTLEAQLQLEGAVLVDDAVLLLVLLRLAVAVGGHDVVHGLSCSGLLADAFLGRQWLGSRELLLLLGWRAARKVCKQHHMK
jgi:hypothetical protein